MSVGPAPEARVIASKRLHDLVAEARTKKAIPKSLWTKIEDATSDLIAALPDNPKPFTRKR